MFGKKALRLAAATALVGTVLGAPLGFGATTPHAKAAGETGVIAITDWQFPDGCNGAATSSVADQEICNPMEDTLFYIDKNLNYQPDLAASIPTQANGGVKIVNGNMVVTYKLKPNLKWSDGSAFTVDEFIFNVKLNIAIGNTFGLDQITNMKKIDDRTIEVTYKGLYAPYYAYGVPQPFYPQAYLEKKYGTTDINAIATKFGTDTYNSPSDVFIGPYQIGTWTNGQNVTLVPDPYYNALPADSKHPRPAQLKFVNIAGDEASLVAALQSANAGVDKAEDFQPSDIPGLQSGKYSVKSGPALFVEHLEFDQNGPLKDVNLRRALTYAIDKKGLFSKLFPSVSNVNDFMLPTVLPSLSAYSDPKIPLSEYNPAKAKQLISAAGYSTDYNGPGKHLTLNFFTTTSSVRQRAFQVLSKYWAEVGVHVNPHFVSGSPSANGGLFSPYNLNGVLLHRGFDIALFAFSESPDPQQSETNFDPSLIPTIADNHHAAGDQNYTGITDQDQFKLLQSAGHTLDVNQRKAIYSKWEKLVNDRAYWSMLYARTNITADNGKIGNYALNPSQAGNEWNTFQWYRVS